MAKVYFSVNDYDFDGDIVDKNIRLHFGNVSVKIGETMQDFDDLIKSLQRMRDELRDTYNDRN